jgi:CheY-like chemotaxis protein/nitrogen-specific signal transduction histidine kinase
MTGIKRKTTAAFEIKERELMCLNSALEAANRELGLRNLEVERATKLKSQFLASMSHELRTPLNAIVGFSDLLADQIPGPLNEKQTRFVGHIKTASRHLLQLINDILDLAKIESGQMDLRLEDIYVADILPEVLSITRQLVMEKKITLTQDVARYLRVHADRVRLKQVLYNLLSNAIKFTPVGGKICVEGKASLGFAVLTVSDSGIGILAQDLEPVFEEFRQVSDTTKGIKEGTGLGLAISRRIIQEHGGRIWAESEIGHGSRFSFTVPGNIAVQNIAVQNIAKSAVPLESSIPEIRGHVLVVDDKPVARELLCNYLVTEGYLVATAQTATEALEKARFLQPDVITLDILMPEGNGFAALFELRNSSETRNIPVIVVSVVDQKNLGLAMGAAEYLVKPVEKNQLLTTISELLKKRKQRPTNVLIIDDDEQILDLLNESLLAVGYSPHLAKHGYEGLEFLSKLPFDAILLDLIMPEMSGFEVLQKLKADERLNKIPVMVMSSKDLSDEESELLKRDATALFKKHGDWKEPLLQQLRKAIKTDTSVFAGDSL